MPLGVGDLAVTWSAVAVGRRPMPSLSAARHPNLSQAGGRCRSRGASQPSTPQPESQRGQEQGRSGLQRCFESSLPIACVEIRVGVSLVKVGDNEVPHLNALSAATMRDGHVDQAAD